MVRENGGIFVLDCIASGALWLSMKRNNVDVLISAPQKGWSGQACAGFVLLNERGEKKVNETNSSSFTLDLKKWLEVATKYESGLCLCLLNITLIS